MSKSFIKKNLTKKSLIKKISTVVILFLSIAQTGCSVPQNMPVSMEGFYFDTICSVTVYDLELKDSGLPAGLSLKHQKTAGKEERARELIQGAFELCGRYEDILSKTRENSDIYRINNSHGSFVVCDPETVAVIKKGIYYGELSGGRFDITVGGLSELWDFHTDDPELPEKEDIEEALKHVGYKNIETDGNRVRLTDSQAKLDIGGLAKGYIADRVSQYLKKEGVKSAVISLGGDVVCIGEKKINGESTKFKVGIETPYSDMSRISRTIELSDGTAVTSGVYERFFEKDGKKYHHILDPKTGYPVQTDMLSATVISDEGASCDCDALATICIMLGYEEAERFMQGQKGFSKVFIPASNEPSHALRVFGECRGIFDFALNTRL